MKKYSFLWVVLVLMAIQVGTLTSARADVVGHLTEVTGRVDVMKGGQPPAIPVNLRDGVEPGDVVRTKSSSKAQITFMDNSTMTIAPESRVAIEAYMFDPAQKKRNAVFQLFRGLAYVVVNKVFQVKDPDFVVKTHTAVMGVRGTEFGVRLHPASSTILNFTGILEVGNFSAEVSGLSRKAFKIALSSGTGKITWINSVLLHAMQGATVARDLPPATFEVTPGMMKSFMNQLVSGLESRREKSGQDSTGTLVSSGEGFAGTSGGTNPTSQSVAPDTGSQPSFLNSPTANPPPPMVLPPLETPLVNSTSTQPSPATYRFMQTYSGYRLFTPGDSLNQALIESYGWGQRTGATATDLVYPGYFVGHDVGTRTVTDSAAALTLTAAPTSQANLLMAAIPETPGFSYPLDIPSTRVVGRMIGTLTGVSGQELTGQMIFRGRQDDGVRFRYTGTATLQPNGTMVFDYQGRWRSVGGLTGTGQGTMTFEAGTYFSQTASGTINLLPQNDGTLVVLDQGGMTGNRKNAFPGKFKGSLAAIVDVSGLGESLGSATSADIKLKMQGVVAGDPSGPLAGVMDMKVKAEGLKSPVVTGPVSLDPNTGVLSAQVSTAVPLEGTMTSFNASWIQAPKGSGIKTDSFMLKADGGNFKQVTTTPASNVATITSTAPMTGHLKGVSPGPMDVGFTLTSTITDPAVVFPAEVIKGKAATTMVGVVAGTPGGTKTGLAQAVTTLKAKSPPAVSGIVYPQVLSGTVRIDPGGQVNAVLKGANPAIPVGARATQTGILTATPASR